MAADDLELSLLPFPPRFQLSNLYKKEAYSPEDLTQAGRLTVQPERETRISLANGGEKRMGRGCGAGPLLRDHSLRGRAGSPGWVSLLLAACSTLSTEQPWVLS